jgi:hypothetical protein
MGAGVSGGLDVAGALDGVDAIVVGDAALVAILVDVRNLFWEGLFVGHESTSNPTR